MAKKPYDYYWTEEQRGEVAAYIKELNEALATYDDKKKEFLAARKSTCTFTLVAHLSLSGRGNKTFKQI